MIDLETLVKELKALPPGKLAEAAGFIRQLKSRSEAERTRALDRAFGCLTETEAAEVEAAIQANCEHVDASQW